MIEVVADSVMLRSGRGDFLRRQPWMQQQPAPEIPSDNPPEITPTEPGPEITPHEPPEITPDVTPETPPQVIPEKDSMMIAVRTWRRIRHGMPVRY